MTDIGFHAGMTVIGALSVILGLITGTLFVLINAYLFTRNKNKTPLHW